MYRVIEGIYRDGKIIIPKFPEIEDKTKVIIAFVDHPSFTEKEVSVEHDEIPLDSPRSLEDIDVTISTADRYRAKLGKAENGKRQGKPIHSPFFSSPPVNLGYTDASMLDRIIAREEGNENIP